MNVIENKTGRDINDVICISKRDGNKKRPYLILNKLQAKYIPVNPEDALEMFDALAKEVKLETKTGSAVVVGFAETATAIGAELANALSKTYPEMSIYFLPTTREDYEGKTRIEFTEDHSHAVEQLLYTENDILYKADYIIFAEDEVTTGNTIRHCVSQLKEHTSAKFKVASLMNCMDEAEMSAFSALGIDAYWLIKTDKEGFENYSLEYDQSDVIPESYINSPLYKEDIDDTMTFLEYRRYNVDNPRLGVSIDDYVESCDNLLVDLIDIYKDPMKARDKILCIGTEECMYPAIRLAKKLNEAGKTAVVQSTTRVPTCVHGKDETTLTSRYEVESLYGKRKNYIYNMNKYDFVFILTDGKILPEKLLNVLRYFGNNKICVAYV